MEKEFVPYELAIKLKELGFDEPCLGYYHVNDGYTKGYAFCYFDKPKFCESDNSVLTPTFSQTFKWFREKYNLDSFIQPTYTTEYQFRMFHVEIKTKVQIYGNYMGKEFKSYEEAELACLTKLIEIVESKSE